MWGEIININIFKTDILADAIEESRLDFEDTGYGKGELSKPKDFSHEKWAQREDIIYRYFKSRKNSCGVPISYVIIKDTPSPEDSGNRDINIIYQASIVGTSLPETQGKLLILSRN